MSVIWVAVLVMACTVVVHSAPAAKYDQRQEGDVNVRADLENFVILIIPTTNTNSLGLLELLTKAMPNKGALKKHGEKKPLSAVMAGEDDSQQHFIESKTAPYHVDISRTRSHLAKLHPQLKVAETNKGEVLIAHSPIVSLKSHEEIEDRRASRSARNIVINQEDDVRALILTSDIAVDAKKHANAIDKSDKKENRGSGLLLLGSDLVQCAPDQTRDTQGICQLVKP